MTKKISTQDPKFSIRFAEPSDTPLILSFIKALAEYENMLDLVVATPEGIKKSIFEENHAEVVIGEYNGKPAGFALFFHNYSTFLGKSGLYLEDLFVYPEFRGKGFGKILLSFLAKLALKRGCGRLEWACLDWNAPSIGFYKSLGAQPMDEWTTYRLTGKALDDLAKA
ncbi:MAG: GNAT family N-acetyltransferase [Eubacteriales bacterium]